MLSWDTGVGLNNVQACWTRYYFPVQNIGGAKLFIVSVVNTFAYYYKCRFVRNSSYRLLNNPSRVILETMILKLEGRKDNGTLDFHSERMITEPSDSLVEWLFRVGGNRESFAYCTRLLISSQTHSKRPPIFSKYAELFSSGMLFGGTSNVNDGA